MYCSSEVKFCTNQWDHSKIYLTSIGNKFPCQHKGFKCHFTKFITSMTGYVKSRNYMVITNTLFAHSFQFRVVTRILRRGTMLCFSACSASFRKPQQIAFDIPALRLQSSSQANLEIPFAHSLRHQRNPRRSKLLLTLWSYNQTATASLADVTLYSFVSNYLNGSVWERLKIAPEGECLKYDSLEGN